MLIAKLRISLRDANIQYNSAIELGTEKVRGTVLADGKVVRGLGTHFANKEAQERFERLTKESNAIRDKFNRQFVRWEDEGYYVINKKGDGKKFIESLKIDPGIDVSVKEREIGATDSSGLDIREMGEWGQRVKKQLTQITHTQKEETCAESLVALETLADCPVFSAATAQAIRGLIAEVKIGKTKRVDFKRSLELIDIEMDQTTLLSRPIDTTV